MGLVFNLHIDLSGGGHAKASAFHPGLAGSRCTLQAFRWFLSLDGLA
jgi:hypothetical protein